MARDRTSRRGRDADVRDGSALADLAGFLAAYPPFDPLDDQALAAVAGSRHASTRFAAGRARPRRVRRRRVSRSSSCSSGGSSCGTTADGSAAPPDEHLGPGGLFGFSAMLTERSIGPRAVAAEAVDGRAGSRRPRSWPPSPRREGARFLAEQLAPAPAAARGRADLQPVSTSSSGAQPLVVGPDATVGEVARVDDATRPGVCRRRPAPTTATGWSPTRCCGSGCSSTGSPVGTPVREVMVDLAAGRRARRRPPPRR